MTRRNLAQLDTNFPSSEIKAGRRKSRRVKLRVSLTVIGYDRHGTPFSDRTQTQNVSQDGGCVVLDRDLRRNQMLRVEATTGVQFPVRVRWCVHVDGMLRRVGFQLNPSSKTGWVISSHH